MRSILHATFSIIAAAFCGGAAHAQDAPPSPPEQKAPEVRTPPPFRVKKPVVEEGPAEVKSELTDETAATKLKSLPSRYQFLLMEAMKRFQVRDFKGAMEYVEKADEVLPPTAWSLNVRGAVAIETRDFEKGFKYCSDSLKLDPSFFPAKFNICEIPFLQGQYSEARKLWMQLYSAMRQGDPLNELLTYRIFLTYLLENDLVQAKQWLDKIPFPSQTPAYQFANAVWARQQGDLAKWDEWLRSAAYIWPELKRGEYVDVLIQLGWLRRD